MSAFLGPIHEKMYARVLYQDALSQAVIDLAAQEGWAEGLDAKLGSDAAPAEKKPLETIIDPGNIHGWLSVAVDRCERRFAALVCAALDGQPQRLDALKDRMKALGEAHRLPKAVDAESAFQTLHDILLDGMPCDFPFAVTEANEDAVSWLVTSCPHAQYWQEEACGVDVYYRLRDAWIAGALDQCGLSHTRSGQAARLMKKEQGNEKC